MKTLSTYSIKGGVGKTATAVNLSFVSARNGFRTLVWDLDPQGAASYYFRIKPKVKGGSVGIVNKTRHPNDLIKATDFDNLDLLPADFSYRNMDLLFDDFNKPTRRLAKILRPIRNDYDVVIIDAPPGISLVSENVLNASDAILVPTIPTTLSVRTLEQIVKFVEKHRLDHLKLLPFFSMVDRRKSLHRDIVHTLSAEFPGFLSTAIPNSADIERMGQYRKPVLLYSSDAPALAYQSLWEEIKIRLGMGAIDVITYSENAQADKRFKAKEIRKTLERLQHLI
ncbi:ParA family protein [Pseudomonadota bacterium]